MTSNDWTKREGWSVEIEYVAKKEICGRWVEVTIVDGYVAVTTDETDRDDLGTWGLKKEGGPSGWVGADMDDLPDLLFLAYFSDIKSFPYSVIEEKGNISMFDRILRSYGFDLD